MKIKNTMRMSLAASLLMMLGSCEAVDNIANIDVVATDKFVVAPYEYTVSLTRGNNNQKHWALSDKDMEMEISESEWTTEEKFFTRSEEDEFDGTVFWKDNAKLGLYIKDAESNEYKIRNIPFDPINYIIYSDFFTPKVSDSNKGVTTEDVKNASFFWNAWSQNGEMPTTANFYGIHPRPDTHVVGREWEYERNSVVDSESSADTDDAVSYVFWTPQTDSNLYMFDLMYSKETEENTLEYGNKNKVLGKSISMPFVHAFCLLNISISKGENYEGAGKITSLSLTGTDISASGTLNFVTGELQKGPSNGTIKRSFDEYTITAGCPFKKSVIVPPTLSDSQEEGDRIVLKCKIDDVEYSYSFPDDVVLESGKKYDVNLKIAPTGLSYLQVWNGANVSLYTESDATDETVTAGKRQIMGKYKYFKVDTDDKYSLCTVLKNGVKYEPEDGKYIIDKNSYYNVVTYPKSGWYESPESIRTHFDGKWNTAYNDITSENPQDKNQTVWQDISGHGNDGNLKLFDDTDLSGWDGKGLVFDGINDIVTFPGNINYDAYTMEFYICFDKQNDNSWTPRLVAEGPDLFPAYYLRRMNGDIRVGLFGHGMSQYDSKVTVDTDNKTIIQLDMVYENNAVKFYKNGTLVDTRYNLPKGATSIPEASLGNRSADNTRTTTGTYYSFILYDKALSHTEVQKNYNVNVNRYGSEKISN